MPSPSPTRASRRIPSTTAPCSKTCSTSSSPAGAMWSSNSGFCRGCSAAARCPWPVRVGSPGGPTYAAWMCPTCSSLAIGSAHAGISPMPPSTVRGLLRRLSWPAPDVRCCNNRLHDPHRMTVQERAASVFEEQRSYLFAIAYRLLGSVGDAEDAVQDTYLRWVREVERDVHSPRAFLATVVVRLCLD